MMLVGVEGTTLRTTPLGGVETYLKSEIQLLLQKAFEAMYIFTEIFFEEGARVYVHNTTQ